MHDPNYLTQSFSLLLQQYIKYIMRKEEVKAAINAKESSNPPFEKPILWSDSFLRSFIKTNSEKIWAEKIEDSTAERG